MRVGNHGGLAENIPAYKVCSFSAYSGQAGQFFNSIGHFAAVLLCQHFADAAKILCLCFVKPAGFNKLLHLSSIGGG